jgi:chromosome partitioning protein
MKQAKVIAVAQQKGGAGKTTIAVHLAIAFMQRGVRVALIDTDPQASLSAWHKLREKKYGVGYTGVHFSAVTGWRVAAELSRLRREYEYIIIDCPPHTEADTKAVIRAADLVLIPMQPSPTDIWATATTIDFARKEKIPFYIVMNRVTANSKLARSFSKEISPLLKTTLGNRVLFASSLLEGLGVSESSPSSQATLEIRSLLEEVSELLEARALKAASV